jgi:DNA excision repair protein ERCC-2
MQIYFRHEKVRPFQDELMKDMLSAMAEGKILLANASTGMGKSDAALSASMIHALENDLSIFFLTPKISQHKIAMDVVNGIAKKHSLPLRAVDIVGRSHCCIDSRLQELDNESFQRSCARKRREKNCLF